MTNRQNVPDHPILLPPGGGRQYRMGAIEAVFKADEEETQQRYSVSEWWLEANTDGPGAHAHEANDEVFYVLAGTMTILVGELWTEAATGSFFTIPAGVTHDFANRSDHRAGVLNFFIPGGFERHMPEVVQWFAAKRSQGSE